MSFCIQNIITVASKTQRFWINLLGGTGNDQAAGIGLDPSGNVYITGFSYSQGAGSGDVLVAKYDSSGNILWQRLLGGAGDDPNYGSIAVDPQGNSYIAARTASQGAGSSEFLVAKYNTDGVLQWQRILGGSLFESTYDIAVDSSGNCYVTGLVESQGAGSYDLLIVKYNSSGTLQWQRSLGGSASDIGWGVATSASGNVYVVGQTASQGAGGSDALIVKYNSSGTLQWQRSLGGIGSDIANAVATDSSENVYVTGYTASQGAGGNDLLIAKYDSNGTIQWQRSLGGTGAEEGLFVSVDSLGDVYVCGSTASQGMGSGDLLLAKYDSTGTIQWQRTFGGNGDDIAYGLALDSVGGMYVVARSTSFGSGSNDLLLVKLPSDGSSTGSYGHFTYRVSTLTGAARTLTSATRTLTNATRTLTDSVATLTDQTSTLTSTSQSMAPTPSFWLVNQGSGSIKSVSLDSLDNVYVIGDTSSATAGGDDVLVAKYDNSGNLIWQRLLGGAGIDYGNAGAVDSSGNFYIAGQTTSQGAGGTYMLIAKYDTKGVIQWQKAVGGAAGDILTAIDVDSSGNVYVAGYTYSQGAGSEDIFLAKFDSSGNIQWQKVYGSSLSEVASDIKIDSSGNVYVAGTSSGRFAIIKFNSSGALQWDRRIDTGSGQQARSIAVDNAGNVYAAGTTSQTGTVGSNNDIYVVKMNSSGSILWQRSIGSTSSDTCFGVTVDYAGNVYVCGSYIIKYDATGTLLWQRAVNINVLRDCIVNREGSLYVASQEPCLLKIPADGSLSGTYGSYVISTPSLTAVTRAFTTTGTAQTLASSTLTVSSSTLTEQASTLVHTKTTLQ